MWRASQTGPDLLDVMTNMEVIGAFHLADLSFSCSLVQVGQVKKLHLRVRALEQGEAGLVGLRYVEIEGYWPNPNHKGFEGYLMALLHTLDYQCSKEMWGQSEFRPE